MCKMIAVMILFALCLSTAVAFAAEYQEYETVELIKPEYVRVRWGQTYVREKVVPKTGTAMLDITGDNVPEVCSATIEEKKSRWNGDIIETTVIVSVKTIGGYLINRSTMTLPGRLGKVCRIFVVARVVNGEQHPFYTVVTDSDDCEVYSHDLN